MLKTTFSVFLNDKSHYIPNSLKYFSKTPRSKQFDRKRYSSGGGTSINLRDTINSWHKKLRENRISEPKESLNIIVAHVLKLSRLSDISKFKNKTLRKEEISQINNLCEQRLKSIPVQYIIGEWGFKDLDIKIIPPILIPRPETEQLVDLVSEEITKSGCKKILEIGSGSGVISLSLIKHNPEVNIVAIDKSETACELTKLNAVRNNIPLENLKVINCRLSQNNFSTLFKEKFNVIVSNPPYVPSKRIQKLQPEVALYEDREALDGGPDGLDVIKLILQMAPLILYKNGKLFLEVDNKQSENIASWIEKMNLNLVFLKTHKDIFGKNRFVEVLHL